MDDILDKVEEIMNNLDQNEPKFIDPEVESASKEETVNKRTNAMESTFVPVKKKKKSGAANMAKFIIWVLLLPFVCEVGLTLTVLAISEISLSPRMLAIYIIGAFALQCFVTLWVDWVLGRRRYK